MFNFIKSTNLYSKIELAVWDAEDKVKSKVKDVKEHPGKAVAKAGVSIAVNAVPGGGVMRAAGKIAAKTVGKKAIDKVCDK